MPNGRFNFQCSQFCNYNKRRGATRRWFGRLDGSAGHFFLSVVNNETNLFGGNCECASYKDICASLSAAVASSMRSLGPHSLLYRHIQTHRQTHPHSFMPPTNFCLFRFSLQVSDSDNAIHNSYLSRSKFVDICQNRVKPVGCLCKNEERGSKL